MTGTDRLVEWNQLRGCVEHARIAGYDRPERRAIIEAAYAARRSQWTHPISATARIIDQLEAELESAATGGSGR